MKDYCKYVDVFYGNGETDRFIDNGIGSKWFYIKALCGNTIPHATLPFCKMSVGPYSGGYPTGYGTHFPNSCGGIEKLSNKMLVRGFSHLHQSGVGGIGYYYNYAIATPFKENINEIYKYSEIANENANPGYYNCEFNGFNCEFSVSNGVAIHKYSSNTPFKVAVDFSNDGLSKKFGNRYYGNVTNGILTVISNDTVAFTGVFSGVKLHFVVKAETENVNAKLFVGNNVLEDIKIETNNDAQGFGGMFECDKNAVLKVAYSTVSVENALNSINEVENDFESIKNTAYKTWNNYLAKIDVETDSEDLKRKFYSNFYHTIVKPVDLTGEIVNGVSGNVIGDIATFWDTYKTVFPLILLLYKDFGEKIVSAIENMSKTMGKVPCSFGLTNIFGCEEQAKMLAVYVLLDAYRYGVANATEKVVENVYRAELNRKDFEEFKKFGYFDRFTHILDVTDASLNVAEITSDINLKKEALSLAEKWVNAYDKDGFMSEKSEYYEGDKYTYSFRLQKNISERIALAGGVDKFEKMLDDFFGFNKESVKQITHLNAFNDIENARGNRFEGFNNECDMETPYAYLYTGNYQKLCEIIKECINVSFGLGKGGLPGNNDSGGLSSCFIWNSIGLFPISGSGEFLLGCPFFKKVTFKLYNGNKFVVKTENNCGENYNVDAVYLNGKQINGYKISCTDVINGGTLLFKTKARL